MKNLFTIKFAGRMRRAEYWPKSILLSLLFAVLLFLELALSESYTQFVIMYILTQLSLGLVIMGMTARRLHDAGFSGWMQLWGILPSIIASIAQTPRIATLAGIFSFLGGTLVFVLLLLNSKPEENKYGSNPKENVCGRTVASKPSFIEGLFTVRFAGRMRRQDFWLSQFILWSLICALRFVGLGTIAALFLGGGEFRVPLMLLVITLFLMDGYFGLVCLGMYVRRLHDIGMSGKYLLGMIIFVGIVFMLSVGVNRDLLLGNASIDDLDGIMTFPSVLSFLVSVILIVLFCRDSQYGTNKWGQNPKGQGNTQKTEGAEKYRLTAEQEAAEKYHLAAEQGDAHAQYNLGECYYYGNGVAEQRPQTSPRRLHTQGSPQIQGSLTERWRWVSGQQTQGNPQIRDYTALKEVFIVRFAGRIQRLDFWGLQILLGLLTLPLGWLLNRLSGGVVEAIGLLLLLRVLTGGGLGKLDILSRSLGTALLWYYLLKCGWLVEIASLFGDGKLGVPVVLLVLACLYFNLVSLGMQVRRLHDIGMSGWTILLTLAPILGDIILLVMYCRNSQYGANQWGPNPKGQGNTQKTEDAGKYRLAVEQGNAGAQYALGWCYYHGNGVKINPTEAAKWFRLAAEQGHAKAQFKLGECYVSGKGVNKDLTEAVRWYRLAAEQGLADAQYNLGVCYANGYGVNKDPTEAVRWYRLAAKQENAIAQNKLGMCYYNGEGVDKDYAEALVWYRRAADKGLSGAMYELGKCYLDGIGTEKAEEQAKYWLQKAADNGNTDASELLHHTRTTRELPTKKPKTILFLIVGIISVTLLWLLCVHGREDAPNTASVGDAVQMLKECGILDQYASGKLVTSVSSGIGKEHRRNPIEAISEEFLYHFMMYKDGEENLSEYPYIDKIFELYQRVNAEQQGKQAHIPRKLPVQCLEAFAMAGVKISNSRECSENIFAIDPPDPKLVTFLYTQCAKTSPNQVNVAEANGWTPLMFVARYSTAEACRLLIQAGAKVDKKNNDFTTALMLATCNTEHPDVCGVLIDAGASIHAKDKYGWTPLMWAARYSPAAICERLIKRGTHVNAKENDGWTPLMFAARYSTADACRILIQAGADVNAKKNDGWTPLMLAAQFSTADACRILIQAGAEVNAKNNNGGTPLTQAVVCGNADIVEILLKNHATVRVLAPYRGQELSPLDLAKELERELSNPFTKERLIKSVRKISPNAKLNYQEVVNLLENAS